jgi:hypothetical protein
VLSTLAAGKGARIREQRREEERRCDDEPDIQRLIKALRPITSPAQFASLSARTAGMWTATIATSPLRSREAQRRKQR